MKKNKKIIIIISSILLCTAIIGVILYISIFKDNNKKIENEFKENENKNQTIKYTQTTEGPGFVCSNKELYEPTYSYDKGDTVYCEIAFELNSERPGIAEIWFETEYDKDIEYIGKAYESDNWKLDIKEKTIHLQAEKPDTLGDIVYSAKFRILPTTEAEKLTISFKNIKYKNENNEYYQVDDSIKELHINEERNYKYENSKNNDEIVFYKFDKNKGYEEINKYKCKNEKCYEYASQCTGFVDQDNGKLLILDGNNAILYDFNNGIIGTYFHNIDMIENYFIIQDEQTKKYGIVDLDGKVVKESKSDGYGNKVSVCLNKDTYSIKNDLIIEKKNNKFGIVKISKDELVIEHQFDDIRLYNDKYFKAKIGDKWYLYNIKTKEKVIEEGYKELFLTNDSVLVAQIDNYLYIKDYQGNNIIEDKIKVLVEYNEDACCGAMSGVSVTLNKDIIMITVDEKLNSEDYEYTTHLYEYDIKDKKLTKNK